MDLCAEIDVQFAEGLSGAKVNVQLMYVLVYHRQINTGDDFSTGLCDIGLCRFIRTWLVSKLGIKVESILGRWISACRPPVGLVSLSILIFTPPPSWELFWTR